MSHAPIALATLLDKKCRLKACRRVRKSDEVNSVIGPMLLAEDARPANGGSSTRYATGRPADKHHLAS